MKDYDYEEDRKHRPRKMTDERIEMICEALRKGNYGTTACRYAGISKATWHNWRKKGEEGVLGYQSFYELISQADAEGEYLHVENIDDVAMNGNWQANAWLLERKYPNRWARTERVNLDTQGNDFKLEIETKKSNYKMDDDEIELLKEDM